MTEGVDYVVVEGFKHSSLPKIVMADIEATNVVRRVKLAQVDEALVEELAEIVRDMADYINNFSYQNCTKTLYIT